MLAVGVSVRKNGEKEMFDGNDSVGGNNDLAIFTISSFEFDRIVVFDDVIIVLFEGDNSERGNDDLAIFVFLESDGIIAFDRIIAFAIVTHFDGDDPFVIFTVLFLELDAIVAVDEIVAFDITDINFDDDALDTIVSFAAIVTFDVAVAFDAVVAFDEVVSLDEIAVIDIIDIHFDDKDDPFIMLSNLFDVFIAVILWPIEHAIFVAKSKQKIERYILTATIWRMLVKNR